MRQPIKSNGPDDPSVRENSSRVPWRWIIASGCVLLMLIAIFVPRADPTTPERGALTNRSLKALAESERASRMARPRRAIDSVTTPVPPQTSEEIVARKLRQFGKSRRDLVHAIARELKADVPADVDRFFDAVEGGVGLERDAADLWIQLLQTTRGTDEGSSSAEHGDEVSDATFGLLPDFVRGGIVVREPVGVVRILIRVKIKIGMAVGVLARDVHGAVGAFGGIGEDDICAVRL